MRQDKKKFIQILPNMKKTKTWLCSSVCKKDEIEQNKILHEFD